MSKIAIVSFSLTGGSLAKRIEGIVNRGNRTESLPKALMEECPNHEDPYANAQVEVFALKKYAQINGQIPVTPSLSEWCGEQWDKVEVLIFVGASGIAVRTIAPYVKSKVSDPAVLVIDEGGHFVISLLSGHLGGANDWAEHLAKDLRAIPVITTATDVEHLFAVDVWAKKNHLGISSMKLAKDVSADVLHGKKVLFGSEIPWEGVLPRELTEFDPMDYASKIGEFPKNSSIVFEQKTAELSGKHIDNNEKEGRILSSEISGFQNSDLVFSKNEKEGRILLSEISGFQNSDLTFSKIDTFNTENPNTPIPGTETPDTSDTSDTERPATDNSDERNHEPEEDIPVLIWCGLQLPETDYPRDRILWLMPRCLALGVGCRRGKEYEVIVKRLMQVFDEAGLNRKSIDVIASIDLKKEEEGLIRLAEWLEVPFHTYSAEELAAVEGDYTPSSFVSQITGVDNVCERSAIRENGGQLIVRKQAGEGVTIAAAAKEWRIRF